MNKTKKVMLEEAIRCDNAGGTFFPFARMAQRQGLRIGPQATTKKIQITP